MTTKAVGRTKQRYDEGCAAAFTLGVVGDRWALLVVRELMFTAKRFGLLRAGMPGVTPSVLSGRLADLEAAGIVTHDPTLGSYALTAAGRELRPVLHQLGVWGAGRPGHDPRKFLSPTALMLSLPVMVDSAVAQRFSDVVGFAAGRERFEVMCDDAGEPVVTPVMKITAGTVFGGPANAVAEALYAPVLVAALVQRGPLQVNGDLGVAQGFADCFRTLAPPA